MVYSSVSSRNISRQVSGDTDQGHLSITGVFEEIENVPIDRQSIPQEKLDLANKFRTSIFPWRGQFSPELVELLLGKYAKDTSVVLAKSTVLPALSEENIRYDSRMQSCV